MEGGCSDKFFFNVFVHEVFLCMCLGKKNWRRKEGGYKRYHDSGECIRDKTDEIKIHKKKFPTGAGCFPAERRNACAKSGP